MNDSRYPWTYSSDHIRGMTGKAENGISPKLSRADAARINAEIARILGMDERELANKIADDYLAMEPK